MNLHINLIEDALQTNLNQLFMILYRYFCGLSNNKIIDGAISDNKKVAFFEIKTHSNALSNIREAIGQLLEYSLLDSEIEIDKLVIIGPASMRGIEPEYFNRVRKAISIKLEYWVYCINENKLIDKFKIY